MKKMVKIGVMAVIWGLTIGLTISHINCMWSAIRYLPYTIGINFDSWGIGWATSYGTIYRTGWGWFVYFLGNPIAICMLVFLNGIISGKVSKIMEKVAA